MDKPTTQSSPSRARIRNDLLRVYFCRKLLSEGLLTAEHLYPQENSAESEKRPETPAFEVARTPTVVNGTGTPNPEPTNVQRIFNQQLDSIANNENTIFSTTFESQHFAMAPKAWNCGVYSPIEVFIDSPSAVDNSGQASTMLSSMASEDLSAEGDLFEMDVLERINRLRRQGKWSLTRLPLCLDAPRPKTHYDYFLEECTMMHMDFVQERVTKKMAAKILAYEAKHYVQQRSSGIISLCTVPGPSAKRARKRAGDSISNLISNLPADYVGDLKSRVASTDLFKDLAATNDDKWTFIEEVCAKISSVRPENLLEPTNPNTNIRSFAGTLRPYQVVGLKWLLSSFDNAFGCILADEPKLGKRVQLLALLAHLEEHRRVVGPHLIVTDEAANWSIALERFLPHVNVFEFTDQKDNILHNFNICLVDYETFFSDSFANSFGSCAFQVQIVDKVDQLELLEEKSLEYLLEESPLHGDYRFRVFLDDSKFLERTFEQKRLPTMLLQLLLPKQFQTVLENGLNDEELKTLSSKRLVSFLQSFRLSRTKSQTCTQIPSSSLEVCKCRMTEKQQLLYNALIGLPEIKQALNSDRPMQAVDLLRKCCFHPFLVQEDRMEAKTPLNFSLWYPILRQCFLDQDRNEHCEQLQFEKSFRTRLQSLQTSSLDIASKSAQSLVCCSPPTNGILNVRLHPAISTNPFQFVGQNSDSLSTIWHQSRFKQLASDLFSQRSHEEDATISSACLCLPDKSLILPYSGKLQELFRKLTKLRRQQKRCVIFTSYQSTQDLLCAALAHHNFTYMTLSENVDRKEFLDAFNKNQRIACVLASTRDSLYRLNLNNIGAMFMLETDWEPEFNDNIKRFFIKSFQSAGAKFYNLVTEESVELRTNVFDADIKSLLSDIGRSAASAIPTTKMELDETQNEEQDLNKGSTSNEFTTLYAPICPDVDGVESTSDTMSTSGYEGSLDDNASVHAEPLVYDRNFFESDSYLSSVFGLQWRQNANNDKVGFVEEAQVFDSFSNLWYTGEIIEPEEIEYTKMTPSEQPLDEDTLFDFGEDQENQYLGSGAMSPKSTDEFMDLSTPPTSVEASRISTEFSLDPAIQMPRMGGDHEDSRMKRSQRMQSRTDELRRKLLETQAIVLPDPDPLFRLDGKPGYTPSKKGTEWHDTDTPSWTYIEDHALLALTVKQMTAVPIPTYISRSFCINWELIAFELDKSSFHRRSPNQCCTRFRELIAKKFAPVEDPPGFVEQFEGIDLSALKDERVLSSSQQTTKFFNRSVSALARKLEDLKRIRNTWQARSNWLNSCDDGERFDILNKLGTRVQSPTAFDSSRLRRLMDCPSILPSHTLTANKKGLPLDMVMVYHQYSRGLRLSRVITAAKTFCIKAMKKPVEYQQIAAYSQSVTYADMKMFVKTSGVWELQTFGSPSAFNHHSVKAPKVQVPLENRLLWVDQETLKHLDSTTESNIFGLLQFNFMQFTVDIRSNMLPSRKPIAEILKITSNFVLPKMPKRPKRMIKQRVYPNDSVDEKLLEDVRQTLSLIDPTTNPYRVMRNGMSILPIRLQDFAQNDAYFYSPVLPRISSSLTIKFDQSIFGPLSQLFAHKKPKEDVKKNATSIANLLEDLLIECQDRAMFGPRNSIQIEENPTNRLFSTNNQSNLILRIQKRPVNKNKSSTKRSRHLITCIPNDHFELHNVTFDTKTQQFCAHDLHTQHLLNYSIAENKNAKTQMRKFVSKIESSSQLGPVLTINKQPLEASIDKPERILFNSTVCNLNSVRVQQKRIGYYANEGKQIAVHDVIPQLNNYPEQHSNFAYTIRSSVSIDQIPLVKQKRRQVQFEELFASKKLPFVSCIDANSTNSMRLLISQKETSSNESIVKNAIQFDVEVDRAGCGKHPLNAIICIKNSTRKHKKSKLDSTALEDMLQLLQQDEESINVENLSAVNQFYKLSQPTIGYNKNSKIPTKLPQATGRKMAKIEKFISARFKSTASKTTSIQLDTSTKNPLKKLVNEQYSAILAELQQLQGNKNPIDSNRNGVPPSPIALKLQLRIKTPQFTQILPTSPSKFRTTYSPTDRLLKLQYQTPIQQEKLTISYSNGSRVAINVEFQQLENVPVTPSKLVSTPQQSFCLFLEEPLLKNELIHALMKMPDSERRPWFATLKHRFLRHKNLEQKRRILCSVDRMQKMVDEVLVENGEELKSQDHETDAEHKKTIIRKLLASTDTKYPVELTSKSTTDRQPDPTKHESSLQLADLLLQTIAKSQLNLSKRVHPTFKQVDLTTESQKQWSNKKEVLKIDYNNADKQVVVFNYSLENFFEQLNHELSPSALKTKPIDSSEDIYDQLLCRPNIAPSKIIKYRAPIEVQSSTYPDSNNEQQISIDLNTQPTTVPADLNVDQYATDPHYVDDQSMPVQQTDSNRERQVSSIQIPSAMQVPASAVYHLQDVQTTTSGQPTQQSEPVYYTKRNLGGYTPVSGNSNAVQRIVPVQAQTPDSRYATTPALNAPKREAQQYPKTTANRPMVRHVVVGNRPKMHSEMESVDRQYAPQRDDSITYETRYYQASAGQRELTVREKLQQDMARGTVSNQKKLYPVRVPTTMKRKASESQQYGGESPTGNDPKRSRTAQYMYQVKGPATSSMSSNVLSSRPVQTNTTMSISNAAEQQSTSQTVPMIFHHGEPIKTYIRRENHQFAIHDPVSYPHSSSATLPQYSKGSSQHKVYEKRSAGSEVSKATEESETQSNSV